MNINYCGANMIRIKVGPPQSTVETQTYNNEKVVAEHKS